MIDYDYVTGEDLCICLACGHKGYIHAEAVDTGDTDVLCPECFKDVFYIYDEATDGGYND